MAQISRLNVGIAMLTRKDPLNVLKEYFDGD